MKVMRKIIHWAPRVLSIIIVLFFAIFIAEAFDSEFGLEAGIMHGILTLIALGATILAWKRPKIGGWPFIAFGIFYISQIMAIAIREGRIGQEFGLNIIGIIPLITGVLFLIDGYKKK